MSTTTSPSPSPLGRPAAWALDFGIIGGISGYFAPAIVSQGMLGPEYLWATGISGAMIGAILGAVLPLLLVRAAANIPFILLLLCGPAIGGVWGACTGAVGGAAILGSKMMFAQDLAILSVVVAGVCGALQFGWLWLPYTLLRTKQRRTWPVVLLACLLPKIGYTLLCVYVFMMS